MPKKTFERVEKKFLLTREQYQKISQAFSPYFHADQYGQYTICNVYFDTPDDCLIHRSLEKPPYKEKLRLRSYGTSPGPETLFFLEIKKKYKGVVYKRRITLNLQEAEALLERGALPDWRENDGHSFQDRQILGEMRYFLSHYHPAPKLFLGYDRIALAGIEDPELRVTFDTNLRWRDRELDLRAGDYGEPILSSDQILMEIKIPGTAPVWLAHLLSELGAFHTSFSKYGTWYTQNILSRVLPGAARKEVPACA